MREYELSIEAINPCGGSKYARREILEIEAESPESYVRANGVFPIREIHEHADGTVTIVTGDGHGYITTYTFTEF